jgi:competence protein ComFC
MIFKCLLCGCNSFKIICKNCQDNYIKPKFRKRGGIVSFYDYDTVEFLIKYKYHRFGHRIYKILAGKALKVFAGEIKEKFYVIPVDDSIKKGYSHTAVLANSMKTSFLTPLFGVLHAKNSVRYAGKSLEFRLQNPRDFKYTGPSSIDVLLVDDLLTTGLTLNEAEETLKKFSVKTALKIVLCDLGK